MIVPMHYEASPSPLAQAIAVRIARDERDIEHRTTQILEEPFRYDNRAEQRRIRQDTAFVDMALRGNYTQEELVDLRVDTLTADFGLETQHSLAAAAGETNEDRVKNQLAAKAHAALGVNNAREPLRRLEAAMFISSLLRELPVAQETADILHIPIETIYQDDEYYGILMRKVYDPTRIVRMHVEHVKSIAPERVQASMLGSVLLHQAISLTASQLEGIPAYHRLVHELHAFLLAEQVRWAGRAVLRVHQYWGVHGMKQVDADIAAELDDLFQSIVQDTDDADS
jgi:hypothetical protein